ncbi:MAG: ATP-binding protein [Candidatus Omnitrophota bacterium]
MRTINKIFIFIFFVLAVLAAVTLTALNQITEVGASYRTMEITGPGLSHGHSEELIARHVIWAIFWISLFFVVLIGLMIIYTTGYPLSDLRHKANRYLQKNNLLKRQTLLDDVAEIDSVLDAMNARIEELSGGLIQHQGAVSETRQRQSELEKVNKELDRFVYTVSHDIRAPLTGIAGYADYLKKHCYDHMDARAKRSIDGIIKSTLHLNQLINDFLEVTRVTRVKNPYEPTDFNEVVNAVLERVEYDIERLNVDISVQKNLPVILCDKIKMTGVFFNLINNAIKFSAKIPGQRPKIEIGYKDYPSCVQFYVNDNGIGIPEHLHEEIFELFKRANNVDEYEGTGAGLSIVKATIEDQGGKIWIESKPGYGATFYFTVPKTLEKS